MTRELRLWGPVGLEQGPGPETVACRTSATGGGRRPLWARLPNTLLVC